MLNSGGGHRRGMPDARFAIVNERKIAYYLLSSNHPAGRAKAAFFRRFGFRLRSWRGLRDALLNHAYTAEIVAIAETEFGTKYITKYILSGPLTSPDGRNPNVCSVRFVAMGDTASRLVTAYPVSEGSR
jgi:hypothetical protein